MIDLNLIHLRFDCIATSPIQLGGHFAGNNLRNAIANVIRRATCTELDRTTRPSDAHVATCPACWLLSANLEPGAVVRAYSIVPPQPPIFDLEPKDRFSFGLTLFGHGIDYLPYLVLAAHEAGQREGIGKGRREGLGRYRIDRISAIDPLNNTLEPVLSPGETLVHVPTTRITPSAVTRISQRMQQQLPPNNELTLHFISPLRLIDQGQLLRMPDFGALFGRHLFRLDQLNQQFAGGKPRPRADVLALQQHADRVRLIEASVRWQELNVHSGRRGRTTPLGGIVGSAVYRAADWRPLLPYLVWMQAIQVGKATAKGDGVVELHGGTWPAYWQGLRTVIQSDSRVANPPTF